MSFREKLKKIVDVIREPEKAPVVLPPKRVFADGICDVCQRAMHEHNKKDCNGWPLELIDEPQAVVRERERLENEIASARMEAKE